MGKSSCPICGKPMLLDYHVLPVVCSQCDSDLKAYMLLNEISESEETVMQNLVIAKKMHSKYKILFVISSICIAVYLSISVFLYLNKVKEYNVYMADNRQLSTSITLLKKELDEKPISSAVQEYFEYTVKHGDSFSKLAYMFYGSGRSRNSEIIAVYNNMKISDLLMPGEKLKIKITTK